MTPTQTHSALRRCSRRLRLIRAAIGRGGPQAQARAAALLVEIQLQAMHRATRLLGGDQ